MSLYVFQNDGEDNASVMREASPAELLEAARPHADLEAAFEKHYELRGSGSRWNYKERSYVRAIVLAALGADDE